MSDDANPADEAQPILALDHYERRVLGVLVEKSKTTPDAYPLSLNALTTGCNQKSNRDPVMNLDDAEVEDTLEGLQKKGLVIRITGSGRVERWRHNLYEAWSIGKVELAILAELLLRGAQTVGELRGRASRMEEIADLEVLREHLAKLAARNMVVWLSPPGQRGARIIHGFLPPAEIDGLKQHRETESVSTTNIAPTPRPAFPVATSLVDEARVVKLEEAQKEMQDEIARLRSQVSELQSALSSLSDEMQRLKAELGA